MSIQVSVSVCSYISAYNLGHRLHTVFIMIAYKQNKVKKNFLNNCLIFSLLSIRIFLKKSDYIFAHKDVNKMADNMEYVGRAELSEVDHRLTKEIKENREHIDSHSREIARLEAVYNSLEGLPVAITNLEKTMVVISNSIETMGNNLNEVKNSVHEQEQNIKEIKTENKKQNEEIESIDNKSKVDIMLLIRDNFWKILSLFAVGYAVVEIIMKKVGG